jgi:cytochrome P450
MFGKLAKDVHKSEGKSLGEVMKMLSKLFIRVLLNPIYGAIGKFLAEHNWMPELKTIRKLRVQMKDIISKEYEEKSKLGGNSSSVMDFVIRLRKEAEASKGKDMFGLDLETLCSNMELFKGAANDTSLTASTTLFCLMAGNAGIQAELRDEILGDRELVNGEYNLNNLDKKEGSLLNNCFKELLRMFPPAPMLIDREVVKDFKMDGVRVKKGDYLTNFLIGYDEEFFQDSFKFNPKRFNTIKTLPRKKLIPFSFGKRGCPGQVLAEIMVKVILIEFLKGFKIEAEEGWKMKVNISPNYSAVTTELIIALNK